MELVSQNSSFQWIRTISETPFTRQIGFMVGLSASIALGLSVVFWSQSEDYVPLYMDLDMQSASEVVDVLERNNTPFRMDKMSGTIQVPSDQLHRLRMQLAAEGLPSDQGSGFDMLKEDPKLGISGFMEKARYDHALEQELAQTVSTIANVKSARVHLAVPKASGFIRKSGRPAASVLVNLYTGRELSKRQLAGITHLVAASVPEMLAEDVSVVDQEGRLLSNNGSDMGLSAGIEQLDVARAIEQNYVDRILEILVPIAGPAGVRTQVNADLDFTSFESTSETYSPERVLRSEQVEESENETRQRNGGVPGTLSNQPPDNPNVNQGGAANRLQPPDKSSNLKATRNFEVDKTISHERKAPGVLKRLTVAVVLDHKLGFDTEGNPTKQPYSQTEIDQIRDLVREAVGFDTKRGDRVTVSNTAFAERPQIDDLAEPTLLDSLWVWEAARIAVLLVFAVIRPIMRSSVVPVTAQSKKLPVSADSIQGKNIGIAGSDNKLSVNKSSTPNSNEDPPDMDSKPSDDSDSMLLADESNSKESESKYLIHQQETPLYRHQLDAARDLVEQQPETVAHVVKHWVSKDDE